MNSQTIDRPIPRESRQGNPPTVISLTPVSWQPRVELSLREWLQHGRRLGSTGRHVGWWIGDWLSYGNAAYGERYARASKITGYDVQTLMNMVYVASQVGISRRRENLSWSHHAEVAPLSEEEQQRWLALAEMRRLSVRDLREELRRERRQLPREQLPAPDGESHRIRSDPEHHTELTCPECGHTFALGRSGTAA